MKCFTYFNRTKIPDKYVFWTNTGKYLHRDTFYDPSVEEFNQSKTYENLVFFLSPLFIVTTNNYFVTVADPGISKPGFLGSGDCFQCFDAL